MNEWISCTRCGRSIEGQVFEIDGEYICEDCFEDETFTCDCCGTRHLTANSHSDENTIICGVCFDNHYHRCERCNCLVHDNDAYWDSDYPYCSDCYNEDNEDEEDDDEGFIHDYYYKPAPIFYHCPEEKKIRYYGIELEIDKGGKDDSNAEFISSIANRDDDVLYIKSDGSLEEGMELVSHPCSLMYHRKKFPWEKIMKAAVNLHYRSHNTTTCGYHIHIGRESLGNTVEEQEEVISRIMFFFESHWNELFKLSRRSEWALDRWAGRHGYNDKPKDILDKAKKSSKGRYACVNITNANTVEIRMFRGTLKLNTFLATLELVDMICENAIRLTDSEIHSQSWSDFVYDIPYSYAELINYLKEKRLYINEPVETEEEL